MDTEIIRFENTKTIAEDIANLDWYGFKDYLFVEINNLIYSLQDDYKSIDELCYWVMFYNLERHIKVALLVSTKHIKDRLINRTSLYEMLKQQVMVDTPQLDFENSLYKYLK